MVRRPIRPIGEYRPGEGLALNPPGTTRRRTKYPEDDIAVLVERLRGTPAHLR
jgi:hypothetical protein